MEIIDDFEVFAFKIFLDNEPLKRVFFKYRCEMKKFKINSDGLEKGLRESLSELIDNNEIPAVFSPAGFSLSCRLGKETSIEREGNSLGIVVRERAHFFRAVSVLCQKGEFGDGEIFREKCKFENFGILIDNLRNAVLKSDTIDYDTPYGDNGL